MDTFIDTCDTCASLTVAALPSAPKRLRRFHIVRHDTDGRGGGSFLFEALGGVRRCPKVMGPARRSQFKVEKLA